MFSEYIFNKFVYTIKEYIKYNISLMEQFISNLIEDLFHSFSIPFCITVNVATYLIIKSFTDYKKCNVLTIWQKRLIFLAVALVAASVYYATGSDYKILFNSMIIAPVSWSWIFKPIFAKLKIDYDNACDVQQDEEDKV